MTLKDYISERGRRNGLAAGCGTSKVYLWQLANGYQGKRPSAEMARRIEEVSGGAVSAVELVFGAPGAARKPRGVARAAKAVKAAKGGVA